MPMPYSRFHTPTQTVSTPVLSCTLSCYTVAYVRAAAPIANDADEQTGMRGISSGSWSRLNGRGLHALSPTFMYSMSEVLLLLDNVIPYYIPVPMFYPFVQ